MIPEEQRHPMTKYLPGDILKMKDGTIGMVGVAVVGDVSWNDLHTKTVRQSEFSNDGYTLIRIPTVKFSRAAWWSNEDVTECIYGPMHELLTRLKVVSESKQLARLTE